MTLNSFVGIIDYGVGNIFSIKRSLDYLGVSSELTGDIDTLSRYDKIILPGVGAFGDAKAKLDVDYALLIDEGNEMIKKVGIIGGGGSRDWPIARDEGCDIYISGDAPHHVRRAIVCEKFNYLDVPHEVEKIFMPQMKKILLEIDPTLNVLMVDHEEMPKVIK